MFLYVFLLFRCQSSYNNNPIYKYFLDGVLLEKVKNEKDLGLIFNEDLGWDDNIRSCIKDANRCIKSRANMGLT